MGIPQSSTHPLALVRSLSISNSVWVASLALLSAVSWYLLQSRSRAPKGLREAPSPPGYPIIGNLPDVIMAAKSDTMHLLMQRWAKQYGPVVKVKVGPVNVSSDEQ